MCCCFVCKPDWWMIGWWYLWKDPKRNDRKAFPQMFGSIPSWRQDGTAKLWTMDDYDCIKESQSCKCFGSEIWETGKTSVSFSNDVNSGFDISFDWDICCFCGKPKTWVSKNVQFDVNSLRYKTDRPLNDIAISPLYCSESVGVALLTFDIRIPPGNYHCPLQTAAFWEWKPPSTFITVNSSSFFCSCYSSLWTSPDPELFYYPPWPGLQDAPADGWWTGCQGAATGFWIDSKFDSDIRILHN